MAGCLDTPANLRQCIHLFDTYRAEHWWFLDPKNVWRVSTGLGVLGVPVARAVRGSYDDPAFTLEDNPP